MCNLIRTCQVCLCARDRSSPSSHRKKLVSNFPCVPNNFADFPSCFWKRNKTSSSMTTLFSRVAGLRCSTWGHLGACLRGPRSPPSRLLPRYGERSLVGGGRPAAECGRRHIRGQHTEAVSPVEVDLKWLEGGDNGTDSLFTVLLKWTPTTSRTWEQLVAFPPPHHCSVKPASPICQVYGPA